jgi:hypothetical protein
MIIHFVILLLGIMIIDDESGRVWEEAAMA